MLQNLDCGYSLEPPQQLPVDWQQILTSTLNPHNLSFEQKYEKYQGFLSEIFQF